MNPRLKQKKLRIKRNLKHFNNNSKWCWWLNNINNNKSKLRCNKLPKDHLERRKDLHLQAPRARRVRRSKNKEFSCRISSLLLKTRTSLLLIKIHLNKLQMRWWTTTKCKIKSTKFLRKKKPKALKFTTGKVVKLTLLTSIQVRRISIWLKNRLDNKWRKRMEDSKNNKPRMKDNRAIFRKIKKMANMKKNKLLKPLQELMVSLKILLKNNSFI